MRSLQRILLVAAALGFTLASTPASLAQTSDSAAGFGHIVQIVGKGLVHAVSVDGRFIYNDTTDAFLAVRGIYESEGQVYALISEASGGVACPSLYRAIDLNGLTPTPTKPFGTCSDIPSVVAVGGKLVVGMPAMTGRANVNYIVAGSTVTEQQSQIHYGDSGPPLVAGDNLAGLVVGKHIHDAIKLRAVVEAISGLVGPANTRTILDWAAGGPGTNFERRGGVAAAMACKAHDCGNNQARIAFDNLGHVWVTLRRNGKLMMFGNPTNEIAAALLS